jgi:hypothetical protein
MSRKVIAYVYICNLNNKLVEEERTEPYDSLFELAQEINTI